MDANIQEQLKYPSAVFAACIGKADNSQCAQCLRRMVWDSNEMSTVLVLRKDMCRFYPLRTWVRKYGIPDLSGLLTHADYLGFIHDVRRYMAKATYYRYVRGEFKPDRKNALAIEKVWSKYSKEPFPWQHEETLIDWDNNIAQRE